MSTKGGGVVVCWEPLPPILVKREWVDFVQKQRITVLVGGGDQLRSPPYKVLPGVLLYMYVLYRLCKL